MNRQRSELKAFFQKGATPTQDQFADLIDSALNLKDDGVTKTAADPFGVRAVGGEESLLNFYRLDQGKDTLTWQVKQKPASARPGLLFADTVAPRLYIESGTGNVGVGTTTPTVRLDVAGDVQINGALKFTAATRPTIQLWNTDYTIGIQGNTLYLRTYKNVAFYRGGTHADTELGPGGGTLDMVLTSGNLGVGVSDPKARLHVNGDIRLSDNALYLRGGSDVNHGLLYCGTGHVFATKELDGPVLHGYAGGGLGTMVGGQKLALQWDSTPKVTVNGTLDVSGTITSASGFHVKTADSEFGYFGGGDVILKCGSRGTGGRALVHWENNVLYLNYGPDFKEIQYSGNLNKQSSRALKDQIVDLSGTEAAAIVEELRPVKYHLKSDMDKAIHFGFIAEEVPDAIASADRKTITSDYIVAVLARVVADQRRELANLSEQVRRLSGPSFA